MESLSNLFKPAFYIGRICKLLILFGVPDGIRTRVTAVKGRCPRPLDDGDMSRGTSRTGWRSDFHYRIYQPSESLSTPL